MENNRDVKSVIKEINKLIPITEAEFKHHLMKYYDSLWNQAPEALRSEYCWNQLINILHQFIPALSENWHFQIQKIISNE